VDAVVETDAVVAAAAHFVAAFETMIELDVASVNPEQLALLLQTQERVRRRMVGWDHHLVAELSEQITTARIAARNPAEYLVATLRLSPSEARRRVSAAGDLGPRRALSGELLPPLFPQTAAAQQTGAISEQHAAVIRKTVTMLPADVETEHGPQVEQSLVRAAQSVDPRGLDQLAARIVAHLHPDGPQPSEELHERHRNLSLRVNADRSGDLRAHLTPATTARLQAVLGALSRPRTAHPAAAATIEASTGDSVEASSAQPSEGAEGCSHSPGGGELDANELADPRTPGQRHHDALTEVLDRILRSGSLPAVGGLPATVYLTIPLEVLEERVRGFATTSRGQDLTVAEMLDVASEALVIPIVIDRTGLPLDVGYSARFATPAIRHAANVRDQGCTFPGCSIPAEWCQAHHDVPWTPTTTGQARGRTKVSNIALLCAFHHHVFESWGWQLRMTDGIPWWIPPPSYDPAQKPIRNHAHHPDLDFRVDFDPDQLIDRTIDGATINQGAR
jgi:hypothetical protein